MRMGSQDLAKDQPASLYVNRSNGVTLSGTPEINARDEAASKTKERPCKHTDTQLTEL
jgi:hypothetical protein